MRLITFSILLLFSTQAFGMLRQFARLGLPASKQIMKQKAFTLQKRRFSLDNAATNVGPQKKCSKLKLASVFFAGGLVGSIGGGALGFNVGLEAGFDTAGFFFGRFIK